MIARALLTAAALSALAAPASAQSLLERAARGAGQALAEGAAFGAAVDQRTATFDVKLAGAREVAFFPPFTGG